MSYVSINTPNFYTAISAHSLLFIAHEIKPFIYSPKWAVASFQLPKIESAVSNFILLKPLREKQTFKSYCHTHTPVVAVAPHRGLFVVPMPPPNSPPTTLSLESSPKFLIAASLHTERNQEKSIRIFSYLEQLY